MGKGLIRVVNWVWGVAVDHALGGGRGGGFARGWGFSANSKKKNKKKRYEQT